MRPLQRFLARLLNSALRRRDDKRLREEMQEHVALQIADNLRAGLSLSEARRQALLKFGVVEAIPEQYWAEGGLAFLETASGPSFRMALTPQVSRLYRFPLKQHRLFAFYSPSSTAAYRELRRHNNKRNKTR